MPRTPAQQLPPPGPPSVEAGGARRRTRRTRAFPQGGSLNVSASPSLPSTSSIPTSPSTPSLPVVLQPVALRFSGASGEDEDDGGSEGVRDRGSRGEEVEERRGERNPD